MEKIHVNVCMKKTRDSQCIVMYYTKVTVCDPLLNNDPL